MLLIKFGCFKEKLTDGHMTDAVPSHKLIRIR